MRPSIGKIPLRMFYSFVGKLNRTDQRIGKYLIDYFPTYRAAFGEVMNQVYRKLGRSTSYDIQGLVIEPTDECNLCCKHCTPQNSPRENGYLSMGLLEKIVDETPQLTSVILSRRGEPLMHPRIIDMIRLLRNRNVYVSMYTNGTLLDDDYITRLLESGINELIFSMEGTGDFYQYIRGIEYEKCKTALLKTLAKRNEYKYNAKIAINSVRFEDSSNAENVVKEWRGIVDYIIIQPWMVPGNIPRRSACRTLWRSLVVSWNGDVVACCIDQENGFFLGNLKKQSLSELFNGPDIKELRNQHLKHQYPELCKFCHPHLGFEVVSKSGLQEIPNTGQDRTKINSRNTIK